MPVENPDLNLNELVTDICTTIDLLMSTNNLQISLHRLEMAVPSTWHYFLPYNMHQNYLCLCVKSNNTAWQHCINCQVAVLEKACQAGPYIGCCWAGVKEAVFPLHASNQKPMAFMSVSGYAANLDDISPRFKFVENKYGIDYGQLTEAYETLMPEMPDLVVLAQLTAPLRHMITLLMDRSALYHGTPYRAQSKLGRYHAIQTYMRRYFKYPITLTTLADEFNYSYSSISHLFKEVDGKTFTQVLTDIRMDAAKKLLKYTNESIVIIASYVGYTDSNYFTAVFSREVGMPPTEWRRKIKEDAENCP